MMHVTTHKPAASSSSNARAGRSVPPQNGVRDARRDNGMPGRSPRIMHDFSSVAVFDDPVPDAGAAPAATPDAGAAAPDAGPPAPAARPPAPAVPPVVDRIDVVSSPTGAISGYPRATTGDPNVPGPWNSTTTNGVSNVHQIHFHLSAGDSSALTPRRTLQRTATTARGSNENPPPQPRPGGGPPAPGGFSGTLAGPDGPRSTWVKRPSSDKIVIVDLPGFPALAATDFPVTYQSHFTLTVAAGTTDIAQIKYDVLIDKRTATEVPNTQNSITATEKTDFVNGRSLI